MEIDLLCQGFTYYKVRPFHLVGFRFYHLLAYVASIIDIDPGSKPISNR